MWGASLVIVTGGLKRRDLMIAKLWCTLHGVKKKKNLTSLGQPTTLITCANHGNDVICEVEMKCAVKITGSPIELHICNFLNKRWFFCHCTHYTGEQQPCVT